MYTLVRVASLSPVLLAAAVLSGCAAPRTAVDTAPPAVVTAADPAAPAPAPAAENPLPSPPPAADTTLPPPAPTAPPAPVVHASDCAGVVRVPPGQQFQVVLRSNPSTGYQWEVQHVYPQRVVRLVGSRYEADPSRPRTPGAGGQERWTFEALEPGPATVALVYRRPGSAGRPARTERYRVLVQ